MRHPWDEIRATPTTLERAVIERERTATGWHESLLRSYRILRQVKTMLERGDSPETIGEFIDWAEHRDG